MSEEIHDFSRVDAMLASRRRAMFLGSIWKPMLAGVVGAAVVIAAVAVAQPRFVYREVEIPRVTMKDTTVPNIIYRDTPVDHVVPHETVIEIPKIVEKAVTKKEDEFIHRPEFESAEYKGRLVEDPEGLIRFDTGKTFVPARFDPATGQTTQDYGAVYVTKPYWGDWAFCNEIRDGKRLFKCLAIHHDEIVDLSTTYQTKSVDKSSMVDSPATSAPPGGLSSRACLPSKSGLPVIECGTPPATEMITTLVDVNGFERRALVDSGNSFGLSIPKKLADQLVRLNRANRIGSSQTTLADGVVQIVDTIEVRYIVVSGRTLYGVVASVSPSDSAPVLLGLPVLNRLGPWHFSDGRLVITESPT